MKLLSDFGALPVASDRISVEQARPGGQIGCQLPVHLGRLGPPAHAAVVFAHALQVLETEGLVRRYPGRGYYVTAKS
jgi:hypothetical protein